MSKYNSCQGFEKISEAIYKMGANVHFVGVGGVGMYSLFLLTRNRGISASGSDRKDSALMRSLIARGENVRVGNNIEAVRGSSLVVYSLAVSENDKELRLAEEEGIPLVSRAEYLAFLSIDYKIKLSVSGSHGKSTSVAMLTEVLRSAGLSPSAISGASLGVGAEPYIFDSKDYLVFEACEYKDSFLKFSPDITVFTNLELDHTDYFKTLDDIKRSFLSAMNIPRIAIVNIDDKNLLSLIPLAKSRVISFGLSEKCDFRARNIKCENGFYSFSVEYKGELLGAVSLSTLGKFSVYNALGAFAAAYSIGVDHETIAKALSRFSGIDRRFEYVGKREDGAPIIYDYAHHPTEISATLSALRDSWGGSINVVFKAHTYTRTKDLWDGFVEALLHCDKVFLSEIDPIRENAIEGVNARALAAAIGKTAEALSDTEIISRLKETNGAILIMGAAELEAIKNAICDNNIQ